MSAKLEALYLFIVNTGMYKFPFYTLSNCLPIAMKLFDSTKRNLALTSKTTLLPKAITLICVN